MDVNGIAQLISTVGFPIAVSCYLLITNGRQRDVIEANTLAVTELRIMIQELKKDLEKGV